MRRSGVTDRLIRTAGLGASASGGLPSALVLMKVARTRTGAHNLDDYLDACGYAGIAAELAAREAEQALSPL
jgi:hypothetical protein